MFSLKTLKQNLAEEINKHLPSPITADVFEYPPKPEMGDLALPCHGLQLTTKVEELKNKLEDFIAKNPYIKEIRIAGPYLNFILDKEKIAGEILTKKQLKSDNLNLKSKKVVIEYVSPNSNKPLHLGHVRNGLLGEALSNILELRGAKVIRTSLVNDRGIHIAKSMLAYQKFGYGETPATASQRKSEIRNPEADASRRYGTGPKSEEKFKSEILNLKSKTEKGDAFVGRYYVLFGEKAKENPSLLNEAYELLKKWEAGDKPTVALWKKMNNWALRGFDETFKNLGIKFDKIYFESQIYKKAKKRAAEYFKNKFLKKDEKGNIIANLAKFGLANKVVLRADGTSVYATNDIELAFQRAKDFKFDKMIYIVASEQDYYFKQLFKIFEVVGAPFVEKLFHLNYGLVLLPEGKLKSREGARVDADDLIEQLEKMLIIEAKKRHNNAAKRQNTTPANSPLHNIFQVPENERVAGVNWRGDGVKMASIKNLALAALKFYILQVDPKSELLFRPEESVSLLGRTGVYLEYAYARTQSILVEAKKRHNNAAKRQNTTPANSPLHNIFQVPENERVAGVNWRGDGVKMASINNLIMHLAKYEETIELSAKNLDPSDLALYLYDLAKKFNDFYETTPVLNAPESVRTQRILFIKKIAETFEQGMKLLGIKPLQRV